MSKEIHVVTGAFGYSGKYISKHLIDSGYSVRTLTNSINRLNPFEKKVEVYPFNFDSHEKLIKSLKSATVLYNTYWVRFNHKKFKHTSAVENTLKLFNAAKDAGIERIVHISITNPSESSNLEYFNGKAKLEKALTESGISYAILRPTVLFGKEDILINNIAWVIRNFPVVAVFGKGDYRLQPIYVDDLAALAVEHGKTRENIIIDAIGPETFTYRALIEKIGEIIGVKRPIISVPDGIGYIAGWIIGKFMGDVFITREEIKGLKADLLYSNAPPAGKTKLTDWAKSNTSTLGLKYASELARRKNRVLSYEELK